MDLCYFLQIADNSNSNQSNAEVPFAKKRIMFEVNPDVAREQKAYDFANHVNALELTHDASKKRIEAIKAS